jgi:hypothetical protein
MMKLNGRIYVKGTLNISALALTRLAEIGVAPPKNFLPQGGGFDSFYLPFGQDGTEFRHQAGNPAQAGRLSLASEPGNQRIGAAIMIINLTQHPASPEQIAAGVVDLPAGKLKSLHDALTFDQLPDPADIYLRAHYIAELAIECALRAGVDDSAVPLARAMIGGALWLMPPLSKALLDRGIVSVFAFSARETSEEIQPDGSTRKLTVFRHRGFVSLI